MAYPTRMLTFGSATIDILDRTLDDEPVGERLLPLLRAFASDTYAACTFHRNRLDRAGVKPEAIASLRDWRRIPLLGPREVSSASPFDLMPDRYREAAARGTLDRFAPEDRICKVFQTTSSTGRPKVSMFTESDWEDQIALIFRQQRHIPLERCSRVLNCYHAGHFGGKYIEAAFHRLGAVVHNRHFTFHTPAEVAGQMATGLSELGGFNCLAIPPWRPAGPTKGITLDDLLNADVDNFIGRKIRLIRTGGAPTHLPELRLRERVWEANELAGAECTWFIEIYGCSETGNPNTECEKGFLHVHQGNIYTEIIDEKRGGHVGHGERGLVVFTGLKRGSRYLRYLIGDEATYLSERCACGRASPRITEVKRVTEPERLKGGCAAGGY